MNESKMKLTTTLAVMAVFSITMCLGAITPAIAILMQVYSDVPPATITFVSTLPSLLGIPASIIVGMLVGKKIGIKKMAIILILLFIVTGCAPTFINGFPLLLVSRALFGLAIGGLSVLGNPLVTSLYVEDKRANILGIGTFIAFGGAMVMQFVGGFLADLQWNYVFLTHALAIIPLVLILFFLPEQPLQADEQTQKTKKHIPAKAWAVSLLFAVMGILIMPLLLNSSVISATMSDKATIAATVAVVYSIGCMLGGIAFGPVYKIFKRYCMTFSLIVTAIGMVGVFFSPNITILCVSMFIAGIGYCSAMPAAMMAIGMVTPPESVAFATAIMMALMNVGSFLSTAWLLVIGNITGDAVYSPIMIGAIVYGVIGVLIIFFNPFPKQSNEVV
ncbi:MFS transporter [Acetobacterium carbinolicum]|uniref:MFS transporter n=1 Tax=Acetobacterium carbinolicum TaxID=52690 RepID=UPI003BF60B09